MTKAPILAEGLTGRRYVWPPDEPEHVVPSVTTILDNVAKPWLARAAANRVASEAVDTILKWEGLAADDAKRVLANSHTRAWKRKADAGTAVHDAIEAFLDKEPVVDLDEDHLPYLAGALLFLQEHVTRILHYEAVVYNLTYKYAGRVDAICKFKDGSKGPVDWKTGHVSDDHVLQVNAYAHAEFVGEEDGTQLTLPPQQTGYVVQLPGDGSYKAWPVEITPRAFKTFTAYRTVQKWVDDHKEQAFGDPLEPTADSVAEAKELIERRRLDEGKAATTN